MMARVWDDTQPCWLGSKPIFPFCVTSTKTVRAAKTETYHQASWRLAGASVIGHDSATPSSLFPRRLRHKQKHRTIVRRQASRGEMWIGAEDVIRARRVGNDLAAQEEAQCIIVRVHHGAITAWDIDAIVGEKPR